MFTRWPSVCKRHHCTLHNFATDLLKCIWSQMRKSLNTCFSQQSGVHSFLVCFPQLLFWYCSQLSKATQEHPTLHCHHCHPAIRARQLNASQNKSSIQIALTR